MLLSALPGFVHPSNREQQLMQQTLKGEVLVMMKHLSLANFGLKHWPGEHLSSVI